MFRRTFFNYAFFALANIFYLSNTASVSASDKAKEKDMPNNINHAIDNFYDALNLMFKGEGGAMIAAWSHADDITYMGPSGEYLVGWTDIRKEWEKQTSARLGGTVKPIQTQIIEGRDLAVLNCIESGENVINGVAETVKLRSSTVFRKEEAAWKVVGHQTDLLSYLSK